MTKFTIADDIKVIIPRKALDVVFDECDRYDSDETGGRVLGVYDQSDKGLTVSVTGIIEPGPQTERTATYLKQDGAYQEQVFREVERRQPSIEHLGNWHTHHMNGLRHLSGGDIDTYRRIVGHANHNTNFFYALLVVEKCRRVAGGERYVFRHYVLRRGDPAVYEVPPEHVTIVEAPLVWPCAAHEKSGAPGATCGDSPDVSDHGAVGLLGDAVRSNRVTDRQAISEFYPKVKPFQSQSLGLHWRGQIPLVDGSEIEAIVLEDADVQPPAFKVMLRNPPTALAETAGALGERYFSSCRAALVASERTCNTTLFGARATNKRRGKWMF